MRFIKMDLNQRDKIGAILMVVFYTIWGVLLGIIIEAQIGLLKWIY